MLRELIGCLAGRSIIMLVLMFCPFNDHGVRPQHKGKVRGETAEYKRTLECCSVQDLKSGNAFEAGEVSDVIEELFLLEAEVSWDWSSFPEEGEGGWERGWTLKKAWSGETWQGK
jgi:hypothetical protein